MDGVMPNAIRMYTKWQCRGQSFTRKSPSRMSQWYNFREIVWDVAISWQLRGLRDCYGDYVVVTGVYVPRKSPSVALAGEIYVRVWPCRKVNNIQHFQMSTHLLVVFSGTCKLLAMQD